MRRVVVTVAVAACVAVPTTIGILSVRSSDLEKITDELAQVASQNCAAINEIVRSRNAAAAEGRMVVQQIINQSQREPMTSTQRARTIRFLNALFFTLEPIDCKEVP